MSPQVPVIKVVLVVFDGENSSVAVQSQGGLRLTIYTRMLDPPVEQIRPPPHLKKVKGVNLDDESRPTGLLSPSIKKPRHKSRFFD